MFLELSTPDKLHTALEHRLTAYTLGMERYTSTIDKRYIGSLVQYVPSVEEIDLVLELTRKDDDELVVALANRVSFLRRYRKITPEEEYAYAQSLTKPAYQRLMKAIQLDEVLAMGKQDADAK